MFIPPDLGQSTITTRRAQPDGHFVNSDWISLTPHSTRIEDWAECKHIFTPSTAQSSTKMTWIYPLYSPKTDKRLSQSHSFQNASAKCSSWLTRWLGILIGSADNVQCEDAVGNTSQFVGWLTQDQPVLYSHWVCETLAYFRFPDLPVWISSCLRQAQALEEKNIYI